MVMSNTEFDRQFAAATTRGNRRLAEQPVATSVRYDRRTRKIVIELSNGCTLLVPPELAEGLSGASASHLAAVKILGPGTSIEWPKLDVQLSISGLLGGVFGTAVWMSGERAKTSAGRGSAPKPRRERAGK
jgi:hypothetical protein